MKHQTRASSFTASPAPARPSWPRRSPTRRRPPFCALWGRSWSRSTWETVRGWIGLVQCGLGLIWY